MLIWSLRDNYGTLSGEAYDFAVSCKDQKRKGYAAWHNLKEQLLLIQAFPLAENNDGTIPGSQTALYTSHAGR